TSNINMPEGRYQVVNNPQSIHSGFAICSDNGPGNGNMLVVNAADDPDDIWCQTINVAPNTTYAFSVAITTVVASNPAELQFRINGQLLGSSFNAPPTNCTWLEFFELWESNAATSAELCINNQNTIDAGNDFAIDDISFRRTCLGEASITVTPETAPTVGLMPPPSFCNRSANFDLTNLLTTDTPASGTFFIDNLAVGNILNPSSLAPGAYDLRYVAGPMDCQNEATLPFTIDPALDAGTFLNGSVSELDICTDAAITFFTDHLSTGLPGDPGGFFRISGGDVPATIDPSNGEISFPSPPTGSYLVEYIIPSQANCPGDSTRLTVNFFASPDLAIGGDFALDCTNPTRTITDSAPALAGFTYRWERDGTFIGLGQSVLADQGGTYSLIATNALTGCSSTASIAVADLISMASMSVQITPISCGISNSLNGGSIAVTNIENGTPPYLYSLNGGAFGTDSLFANLLPGDYAIQVEDAGGCTIDTLISFTDPSDFFFRFTTDDEVRVELGNTVSVGIQSDLSATVLDSTSWFPFGSAPRGANRVLADPDSSLVYIATVQNAANCIFSDTVVLIPFLTNTVYAPNAFSPNGDGINDDWTIFAHPGVVAINQVSIFDRWGNVVFESDNLLGNDPTLGWNGQRKGRPLPVGVYLWTLEIELFDGRKERVSGEVTLLR
ncbi:MAG: gliding motility-associated C-terminal domain-containing protein, partial [Bacteroidota bacterium]